MKKKLIIFFLIILLFFTGSKMVRDIKTYHVRANSEEYRLIDDVLKKYETGLYPLKVRWIDIDKDKKTIVYGLKRKLGLYSKDFTWEDIETMREMMNAYLAEHPSYYLNDNYSIYVSMQWATQAPWMAITNDKSRLMIEGVDGLYDRLDCIIIDSVPDAESLQVPVQIFKGAKGFYIKNKFVFQANYKALSQMKSVEYYNTRPPENTTD